MMALSTQLQSYYNIRFTWRLDLDFGNVKRQQYLQGRSRRHLGHFTPPRCSSADLHLAHARLRGLSHFLRKHLSGNTFLALLTNYCIAVPAPSMERLVCCTEEAERSRDRAPRTSRQLLWLDRAAMEDYRGTGPGLGRPGCIRIPRLLQDGYQIPADYAILRPRRNKACTRYTPGQGGQEVTATR